MKVTEGKGRWAYESVGRGDSVVKRHYVRGSKI